MTGVTEGAATITATSVLDPSKSASCVVEVTKLERDLNAVIWDEDGKVWWSTFNTNGLPGLYQVNRHPRQRTHCRP